MRCSSIRVLCEDARVPAPEAFSRLSGSRLFPGMATPLLPSTIGFRDSKSYSRLNSIDGINSGGGGSSSTSTISSHSNIHGSSSSSRAGSPAPLPPSDQFAYSTSLRRHEEPHSSLLDFHGHSAAAATAAIGNATGLTGRDESGARFSAYDLPPQQHDHHYAATGTGHSHHPLAHTTQPLTPSSHYAGQSIAQTISTLGTSATTGLPSDKIHAIRELSGPNEFEVGAKDPLWRRFADQFKEPLIMLLLGSAVVSAFVGNYDDAASIVVAVMIVVTGKARPLG